MPFLLLIKYFLEGNLSLKAHQCTEGSTQSKSNTLRCIGSFQIIINNIIFIIIIKPNELGCVITNHHYHHLLNQSYCYGNILQILRLSAGMKGAVARVAFAFVLSRLVRVRSNTQPEPPHNIWPKERERSSWNILQRNCRECVV